ncbi:solute carrier family 9 member C1 isoform X8 [Pogona vitticeps]
MRPLKVVFLLMAALTVGAVRKIDLIPLGSPIPTTPEIVGEDQAWVFQLKPCLTLLLVVSVIFLVGALVNILFVPKNTPAYIITFFIGVALGTVSRLTSQLPMVKTFSEIDTELFFHLFTPVIIFTAAFQMDFHVFKKSFCQVFILAVLGFLMNSACIALLSYKINAHSWSWDDSMLFAIILSTTDPLLSVASVKNVGISNILINLIRGESLLNDAASTIIFPFYSDLMFQNNLERFQAIFFQLILHIFGSAALGFLSSKIITYLFTTVFDDEIPRAILSLSVAYTSFILAECFGMSGVIAVCALGLCLDAVNFSPGMDVLLDKLLSFLTFVAQFLVFLIMGIVIGQKSFPYIDVHTFFYTVTVYLSLILIRALVMCILTPFLSHFGYGFNWRWGAVLVWSGIRGTPTFNTVLAFSRSPSVRAQDLEIKTTIFFYSVSSSLLTLIINSTTVKKLVIALGLCNVSFPKRMARHNVFQHFKQLLATAFAMLKFDRFLADANWALAEKTITDEDLDKLDSEEFNQQMKKFRCPACNVENPIDVNSEEMAELMEEARLRLLTAQIASYQKQYNSGMLSQETKRTLIGAAECSADVAGKFMNIEEVKTYWESQGILLSLKKLLSDWVYNVRPETSTASKNRFIRLCRRIVFKRIFEHTSSLITFTNCIPIFLHFIPGVNMEFLPQLKMCIYYFLSLYIMEAILKVIAMGKKYMYYHWNQFDFLVIILGIADVVLINIFGADDPSYAIVNSLRVFRFMRVLRLFRLLKHIIPKLIKLLERQINKQLSLCYEIAKGYIQAQEDIKCLIEQIAGHETVYVEINKILEKNKEDALKELGLMQRNYPDVVTAVKTKQAGQTVLNIASEELKFMASGGIVDKTEGAQLHEMIVSKRKRLATLPPTIAPRTALELLHNVMWLYNDAHQIDYIKEKAYIVYFDYGDVISEEGYLPEGIHLIVSGMVKLSGSAPRYGVYNEEMEERLAATPYTDYLATGAIIGEVNCLTRQDMEYSVTCETAVQTCFIPLNDLLEAFDAFLGPPSLEEKIWLKIAVDVGIKTLKEALPNQDWTYKLCAHYSNIYLMDVPNYEKCDIYDPLMDVVVLVYGAVQDCQQGQCYYAPCILPKTCHQVQGNASTTKLLLLFSTHRSLGMVSGTCSPPCQDHSKQGHETLGNAVPPPSPSHHSVTVDQEKGKVQTSTIHNRPHTDPGTRTSAGIFIPQREDPSSRSRETLRSFLSSHSPTPDSLTVNLEKGKVQGSTIHNRPHTDPGTQRSTGIFIPQREGPSSRSRETLRSFLSSHSPTPDSLTVNLEQSNVGTSTSAVRPSPDPVAGPSTGVFSPLGQDHSSQSHETLGDAVPAPSTSPDLLTVHQEEGKVRRNIIHVKPYNGQGPWRNTGVFSHLFPDPPSQRRETLGNAVPAPSSSPDSLTVDEEKGKVQGSTIHNRPHTDPGTRRSVGIFIPQREDPSSRSRETLRSVFSSHSPTPDSLTVNLEKGKVQTSTIHNRPHTDAGTWRSVGIFCPQREDPSSRSRETLRSVLSSHSPFPDSVTVDLEQSNVGTSTIAVRPSPDPVAGPSTGVFSPLGQDHSSQRHETLGNAVPPPSPSHHSVTVDQEKGKVQTSTIHNRPHTDPGTRTSAGIFIPQREDPSSRSRETLRSFLSSHSPTPDSLTVNLEQGNVGTSTIAVRPSPDPVAGPSTGVFSPLGQDHSSQSHETLGNAVPAPSTSPDLLTVHQEEGKVRRNIIHVKPYNGQGPWRNTGVFSHLFPDPPSQRRETLGNAVPAPSSSPDSLTVDEEKGKVQGSTIHNRPHTDPGTRRSVGIFIPQREDPSSRSRETLRSVFSSHSPTPDSLTVNLEQSNVGTSTIAVRPSPDPVAGPSTGVFSPLGQDHSSQRHGTLGSVVSSHSPSPDSVTVDLDDWFTQRAKKKKDSNV